MISKLVVDVFYLLSECFSLQSRQRCCPHSNHPSGEDLLVSVTWEYVL